MKSDKKYLLDRIDKLNHKEMDRLIEFIDRLLSRKNKKIDLSDIAGSLTKEEGESMKKDIDDGCENIDPHEW